MIIDDDDIAAFRIDNEHMHCECASESEIEDISLEEILTSQDLDDLAAAGKSCFCNRCGKRIDP
jgi:hypothetical protein